MQKIIDSLEDRSCFPENTKILVIDDVAAMRRTITQALNDLGYDDVHEANDGNTAYDLIEDASEAEIPFKLIISDLLMPQMGGLELLKKLRTKEELASIPFIMLTGHADLSEVISAAQHNVNGYILKPFKTETLHLKLITVYESLEAEKKEIEAQVKAASSGE